MGIKSIDIDSYPVLSSVEHIVNVTNLNNNNDDKEFDN